MLFISKAVYTDIFPEISVSLWSSRIVCLSYPVRISIVKLFIQIVRIQNILQKYECIFSTRLYSYNTKRNGPHLLGAIKTIDKIHDDVCGINRTLRGSTTIIFINRFTITCKERETMKRVNLGLWTWEKRELYLDVSCTRACYDCAAFWWMEGRWLVVMVQWRWKGWFLSWAMEGEGCKEGARGRSCLERVKAKVGDRSKDGCWGKWCLCFFFLGFGWVNLDKNLLQPQYHVIDKMVLSSPNN